MTKLFTIFFIAFLNLCSLSAQNTAAISAVMQQQEADWNNGDIAAYMQGYWQSDSLLFIGGKGSVYGWENTLRNYQKTYATKAQMGKLSFENLKIEAIDDSTAFVIGKWQLDRADKQLGGWYSLLWKKIDGKWKIVVDHSSSLF